MAENKPDGDKHYYTAVEEVALEKRGASEKRLGRQVSMEEQKASRKFLTNEQKSSSANSGTNPHSQASKSNQDS